MSNIPITLKEIYVPIRIWLENNIINFASNTDISQITDNIFVGNISTGTNLELLKKMGITHIVSALSHFTAPFPDDFNYYHISIYDVEESNIGIHFLQCNHFIHNAIKNNGKVYIHCMCGVSRSITLTIAYLMTQRDNTVQELLEFIRTKRPIANPNPGFIKQLEEFYRNFSKLDRLLF